MAAKVFPLIVVVWLYWYAHLLDSTRHAMPMRCSINVVDSWCVRVWHVFVCVNLPRRHRNHWASGMTCRPTWPPECMKMSYIVHRLIQKLYSFHNISNMDGSSSFFQALRWCSITTPLSPAATFSCNTSCRGCKCEIIVIQLLQCAPSFSPLSPSLSLIFCFFILAFECARTPSILILMFNASSTVLVFRFKCYARHSLYAINNNINKADH